MSLAVKGSATPFGKELQTERLVAPVKLYIPKLIDVVEPGASEPLNVVPVCATPFADQSIFAEVKAAVP